MLQVNCKGCGQKFKPLLQVSSSELEIDQPFNSMEACPHCKTMHFYVRDDFHACKDHSTNASKKT